MTNNEDKKELPIAKVKASIGDSEIDTEYNGILILGINVTEEGSETEIHHNIPLPYAVAMLIKHGIEAKNTDITEH